MVILKFACPDGSSIDSGRATSFYDGGDSDGGGGGESGGDSMTKLLALPDCRILLFLEELNTNLPEVSQTHSRRVEKRKKKNRDRALH